MKVNSVYIWLTVLVLVVSNMAMASSSYSGKKTKRNIARAPKITRISFTGFEKSKSAETAADIEVIAASKEHRASIESLDHSLNEITENDF